MTEFGPATAQLLEDLERARSEAAYQANGNYCVLCGNPVHGDSLCGPCLLHHAGRL